MPRWLTLAALLGSITTNPHVRADDREEWHATFKCICDAKAPVGGQLVSVILEGEFTLDVLGSTGRWYEWPDKEGGRLERITPTTYRLVLDEGNSMTINRDTGEWVVHFAYRGGERRDAGHCTRVPLRVPPASPQT